MKKMILGEFTSPDHHLIEFFLPFYTVKRAFSTKWWPGEANAPKIIFLAFLVFFHIFTTYQVVQKEKLFNCVEATPHDEILV